MTDIVPAAGARPPRNSRPALADPMPEKLPALPWLPDGLTGRIADRCAEPDAEGAWPSMGWPAPGSVAGLARTTLAEWRAMRAQTVTPERLAVWVAAILVGTSGPPRVGRDLDAFLAAAHLALGNLPAALFCVETQRQALRAIRFSPSVADLYAVLKPEERRLEIVEQSLKELAR